MGIGISITSELDDHELRAQLRHDILGKLSYLAFAPTSDLADLPRRTLFREFKAVLADTCESQDYSIDAEMHDSIACEFAAMPFDEMQSAIVEE